MAGVRSSGSPLSQRVDGLVDTVNVFHFGIGSMPDSWEPVATQQAPRHSEPRPPGYPWSQPRNHRPLEQEDPGDDLIRVLEGAGELNLHVTKAGGGAAVSERTQAPTRAGLLILMLPF